MSFKKLSDAISRLGWLLPRGLSPAQTQALVQLNPDRIYVENVRSVLRISTRAAERVLGTAARQGAFERCVEVLCPDGVVAMSAQSESELPETVKCWSKVDGDMEDVEYPVHSLRKRTFYRLHVLSDVSPSTEVRPISDENLSTSS